MEGYQGVFCAFFGVGYSECELDLVLEGLISTVWVWLDCLLWMCFEFPLELMLMGGFRGVVAMLDDLWVL